MQDQGQNPLVLVQGQPRDATASVRDNDLEQSRSSGLQGHSFCSLQSEWECRSREKMASEDAGVQARIWRGQAVSGDHEAG